MSDAIGAVPPPPSVIPNFRNPKDVCWTINIVSQAIAMSSITFFFLIRITAKAFVAPPFDREDCMCVVAWVFYMAYSATGVLRKIVYGGSMVYGLNAYFVKVTLLLIFIRVFRPFKKSVLIAWGLIGLMGAYYIPMFFFKMQVCRPIRGFWDRNVKADCLHQDSMLAADTVISTLTDTAILVLPIPASMQLQISWRERVKIIAYLGTGGTAALAAAVRMVLILRMQNSTDFTVDNIRILEAESLYNQRTSTLPITHEAGDRSVRK
ncbi:hypothetical protein MPH_08463 [Macrophomina phaseolina MS6]|uniref:Rhodopsin domain-containing protein n=1 Tax=Macrophomina phaseolina (strain MS6) TaxID=1126212 RepID=K2RNI8_MACPH|nr:hypothetical protein MPH_08463 [Macrophomina phaseolina MS6]